jgi:hypothetical protein
MGAAMQMRFQCVGLSKDSEDRASSWNFFTDKPHSATRRFGPQISMAVSLHRLAEAGDVRESLAEVLLKQRAALAPGEEDGRDEVEGCRGGLLQVRLR